MMMVQNTSRIYPSLLTWRDNKHVGHVCTIFPFNRSLLKACKHTKGVFGHDSPSHGICELVGVDAGWILCYSGVSACSSGLLAVQ